MTLKLARGFLAQFTSVTIKVQSRFSVHKLLQYLNINPDLCLSNKQLCFSSFYEQHPLDKY